MDKKGLGIVVLIVIAGVVGGGFGFLPAFEHNVAVQESQPVDATIVSTDLDVREDDDGDKEYNPIVVYRYEVDGETYEQDNTYRGGSPAGPGAGPRRQQSSTSTGRVTR